ncbi:MAG: hypothetical protein E6Q97_05470 [Desulfurellales bacterium]|nr:MAG: hypothetical protein E6Q97_05470 [Desulfurellales bacterium]
MRTARAWLRATPAWTEDEQEELVRDWCARRGLAVVIYRESKAARSMWLKAVRGTEAAVLPRLDILAQRDGKRSPSADLTITLDDLRSRAGVVADATLDATSADGGRWQDAIAAALGIIRAGGGRPLTKSQARAMARKSTDLRRARSTVALWKSEAKAKERERLRKRVWINTVAFVNWVSARAELPDALRELERRSLERIFGGRTGKTRRPKT